MWHRDAFEAVANHLGHFLHVGEDVLKGMDKRMVGIIMDIDITKGFMDEIKIDRRDRKFHQVLNY